jgi:squalene synthase HpnC
MPVNHYENFPVTSVLLPKRLVPAVEAIYAFARSADDLADEGIATPEVRLMSLNAYQASLKAIERGESPDDPLFARLAEVIKQFNLPMQPFYDLLSAFRQDVVTTRYANYPALLDYCSRSANPVGLLMLTLYGAADAQNVEASNAICSALQLINFLQDVQIDINKDRIYLPMDDLERFGVTSKQFYRANVNAPWRMMMSFEVDRARELMLSGAPLAKRLPGRIGWELRLVIQGGLRILEKLEWVGYDVFAQRPKLGPADWLAMGWRAFRM